MLANLNPVMSIVANVPAAIASTVSLLFLYLDHMLTRWLALDCSVQGCTTSDQLHLSRRRSVCVRYPTTLLDSEVDIF